MPVSQECGGVDFDSIYAPLEMTLIIPGLVQEPFEQRMGFDLKQRVIGGNRGGPKCFHHQAPLPARLVAVPGEGDLYTSINHAYHGRAEHEQPTGAAK